MEGLGVEVEGEDMCCRWRRAMLTWGDLCHTRGLLCHYVTMPLCHYTYEVVWWTLCVVEWWRGYE